MALPQSAPPSGPSATVNAGGALSPGPRKGALAAQPRDPTLQWVVVTPNQAQTWLRRDCNVDNRRLRPSVVKFYADQMKAGLWRGDSPEPIAFDQEGRLIQGQHRLESVVQADQPIRFLVATGVQRDTRLTLDTGISRTGSDALQMHHPDLPVGRAQAFASAIRGLEAWRREPTKGPHENIASRIPNVILTQMFETYRDGLEQFYSAAEAIHHAPVRGGLGLWLTMLYAFGRLSVEQTLDFADKVATGANLPLHDPVLALRDRLNRLPLGDTKPRRQTNARLIVYAWNAFRQGRSMHRLLLPTDGDFPKVV